MVVVDTAPGTPSSAARSRFRREYALPEDDLVFFLLDLVPQIDLSPFHQYYAQELRGQPPFDMTMMVTLLVYAYSVGVCSSRRVAAACERNLAFRAVVGDDPPDFRTLSDFRKIHLAAFRPLFLEVLRWLARWVWSSQPFEGDRMSVLSCRFPRSYQLCREATLGTISRHIICSGQLFAQFFRSHPEELPEAQRGQLQAQQAVRRLILSVPGPELV